MPTRWSRRLEGAFSQQDETIGILAEGPYHDWMDLPASISRIFEHLEDDRVEAATMACLRVARHIQDHINAAAFHRELFPLKEEVGRALLDDAPN